MGARQCLYSGIERRRTYEKIGGWLGAIHPLFVAPIVAIAVMLVGVLMQTPDAQGEGADA